MSVIVPAYQVEQYLQVCINSVVCQSYQRLLIALVDDGSPDGCSEICDVYAMNDARVQVLHCKNGGLSAARNRGMSVCEGKYVYFVDSDDFLEREAVATLFEVAEKDDLDIVLYDAISFDETNGEFSDEEEINKYIRGDKYPGVRTGACLFEEMVKNDDYRSPVQYCFYKKSFLDKRSLKFHEGILHEDEEFNFFALMYADRVKHIPNVLYHHRFRSDSIMATTIGKRNTDGIYESVKVALYESDRFLRDVEKERACRLGVTRLVRNYFCHIKISKDRELPEVKKQLKRLKRELRRVHYLNDADLKHAVKYGLRQPLTVKRIKIKLYPLMKPFLGR